MHRPRYPPRSAPFSTNNPRPLADCGQGLRASRRRALPTYEALPRFTTDLRRLSPAQRRRFRHAVGSLVDDLRTGRPIRPGLRVKRVQRSTGVYELTWANGRGPAGRATWHYGPERRPGTPHVVWRRIGDHDILTNP
ncbi:hypothetical protein [Streptomyces sp. NPDC059247]|uniref:hypothetical protein n=1 Tax=Streptomyces sp. NPDC059247 TaxID=3346790 RepID=UPI0036A1D0C0